MCWKKAKLLLCAAALGGCSGAPPPIKQETIVFGTRAAVTIAAGEPPAQARQAIQAVFAHFENMHGRFHPWREGELQQVNDAIAAAALPIRLSAPMAEMIAQARQYSADSEGLFNPAVGALVQLWGFHADTPPVAPPPPAAVAALLAEDLTMESVQLRQTRLVSAPAALRLDFGAQAKGRALDEAREILLAHGIRNALINIGGNIMALGKNGDRPWRVAIAPDRRAPAAGRVALHDGEAAATSGGSERYFMHAGRRYHHILDPRSGYPAEATWAATVIAGGDSAGAISDAAATALVIADAAESARILPRFGITLAWRSGSPPTPAMQVRLEAGEDI